MTPLNLILDEQDIAKYLAEHGLEDDSVPIEAAMLQLRGTASGHPAFLLVLEVNGRKVVAKTTLTLIETAVRACRAKAEMAAGPRPPGH